MTPTHHSTFSHRSRVKWALSLIIVLALFTLAASFLAGEQLPRSLVASAGGLSSSSSYKLQAAVAQPVAGMSYTSSYRYCSGFLCGDARAKLYLPVVTK